MIAFDTNLLVRLLVDDTPEQADGAEVLLAAFFLSVTIKKNYYCFRKNLFYKSLGKTMNRHALSYNPTTEGEAQ